MYFFGCLLWYDWEFFAFDDAEKTSLDFNSTMVRLVVTRFPVSFLPGNISIPLWYDWQAPCNGIADFKSYFNSTMVRLVVGVSENTLLLLSFQFHYGTIGRLLKTLQSSFLTAFQFHYGTIGRKREYLRIFMINLFQFHYGTIGSLFPIQQQPEQVNFNSTMVRLVDDEDWKNLMMSLISIPLWYDWQTWGTNLNSIPTYHFNSTMVRLVGI